MNKIAIAIVVMCASLFAQEYQTAYSQVYQRPIIANGSQTILPLVVPKGWSTTGIVNYTMLCRDFTQTQTSTALATYSITKSMNGHAIPKVVTSAENNNATVGF